MPLDTQSSSQSSSSAALDKQLNADNSLVLNTNLSYFQFSNTAVRAVDLYNCTLLQEIDLTCSVQDEIHIAIQNCPQLNLIKLPINCKAYIHLDAGKLLPNLLIEGGVSHIDACWKGGRFLQQHSTDKWHKVMMGPWADNLLFNTSKAQQDDKFSTLLVINQLLNSSNELTINPEKMSGQYDLTFVGISKLEQLNLSSTTTGINSLSVLQSDRLLGVNLLTDSRINLCHIDECKSFQTLSSHNPIKTLKIANSGLQNNKNELVAGDQVSSEKRSLKINAQLNDLFVSDCHFTDFQLSHEAKVQFIRCQYLTVVDLPRTSQITCEGFVPPDLIGLTEVKINESYIKQTLPDVLKGDLQAWELMKTILATAYEKEWASLALRTLLEALNAGMDPSEVWYLRNVIYIKNQNRGSRTNNISVKRAKKGLETWHWIMDKDLAEDGWRADWLIASKCLEHKVYGLDKYFKLMSVQVPSTTFAAPFLIDWISKKMTQFEPIAVKFMAEGLESSPQNSFYINSDWIHFAKELMFFEEVKETNVLINNKLLEQFKKMQSDCFKVLKECLEPLEMLQFLAKNFQKIQLNLG